MPNQKNKELVKNIREKVSKAKSITFTDYLGLPANILNDLRKKLHETDSELVIGKNTLIRTALKEEAIKHSDKTDKDLKGPTAVIFSYKDPVAPLKTIYEFLKNFELPKVKSGLFDGIYTTSSEVEEISSLPSKEVLIGRLLGSLKSPITGTVSVLNGVQRKFVYALNAIKENKK